MSTAAKARETALEFPFADAGKLTGGTTLEVAPGVHWLRMPLPFALDHINLWLLEDGDGWVLVDTGINRTETQLLWHTIFETMKIGPAHGRPVNRLIVTHFHPDHVGLAAWLTGELETTLWMSRTEWLMGRMLSLDLGASNHRDTARFYERHGLTEAIADKMRGTGNSYRQGVMEVPSLHWRLKDGQALSINGREWRVIVGTGHSPEHACLHCEELGILISGDQILPRISPNISVWASEPDADPLSDYLSSFGKFEHLDPETLVLPSHNFPFRGVQTRIAELRAHHEKRLAALETALSQNTLTAYEALPHLFRPDLGPFDTIFAMGEAIAHLACLVGRGAAVCEERGSGVYHFART